MAGFGPQPPGAAEVQAARAAEFEALATPWVPYDRYLQAGQAAQQTEDAFFRAGGWLRERDAENEAEAGG